MSPVDIPTAPSRMALSTIFSMACISASVGFLLALPITAFLTSLCPINAATLTDVCKLSILRRYLPIFASDEPQLPVITVVTPSYIKLVASGFLTSSPSICVCTSINPGAATRPVASITFLAFQPANFPI